MNWIRTANLKLVLIMVVLLGLSLPAFAINELLGMDFIPKYSVLNSSALASDAGGLLINPAGLYGIDRINAVIGTGPSLALNYVGFATVIPMLGGTVAFSLYNNISTSAASKQGLAFGWGRNVLGFLAFGASVKTLSSEQFVVNDGILADFGLILHLNESTGIDLFKNDWLNDKLFIGFALQNLGLNSRNTEAEDMNARLGLGYNISPLWTKVFIEKNFLSRTSLLAFGLEINPKVEFFDIFTFRTSYDMRDVKVGFGINGEDGNIDMSYNPNRNQFFLALTGYFETSRDDLSSENYNAGMVYYNQAVEMERDGNPDAFDKYHQAYDKFNTALTYNGENDKAALRKKIIEGKVDAYQGEFLTNAQNAEAKKDYVSALIYYNKADSISEVPGIQQKVKEYSSNDSVIAYVKNKKGTIAAHIKNSRYFKAKKEVAVLEQVVPDDNQVRNFKSTVERQLKVTAQKYYDKAKALYRQQLYEDCMAQAKNALAFNPDMDRAQDLYNLAATELSNKKGVDKAYEQFKKKNYMSALKLVNWTLSKNPDNKGAADLKARILKIFKDNMKTYMDNGVTHYNNSEYDSAIQEFDKVLQADPGNSIATDYRSRAVSKMKALEKLEDISEE